MLIDIVLPVSLAFIMFSLGLGLTLDDFRNVTRHPKAFAVGIINQMVLLPLVGLGLVMLFQLKGAMAVGMMILACCPGGITSNILTLGLTTLLLVAVPIVIGLVVHRRAERFTARFEPVASKISAPFEYPFDPPGWIPEGRDGILERILADSNGTIALPSEPGFGFQFDRGKLRRYAHKFFTMTPIRLAVKTIREKGVKTALELQKKKDSRT